MSLLQVSCDDESRLLEEPRDNRMSPAFSIRSSDRVYICIAYYIYVYTEPNSSQIWNFESTEPKEGTDSARANPWQPESPFHGMRIIAQ